MLNGPKGLRISVADAVIYKIRVEYPDWLIFRMIHGSDLRHANEAEACAHTKDDIGSITNAFANNLSEVIDGAKLVCRISKKTHGDTYELQIDNLRR